MRPRRDDSVSVQVDSALRIAIDFVPHSPSPQSQFLEPTKIEQRTATAAVAETETGGFDSAVETPEIAVRENLTKKSEGK